MNIVVLAGGLSPERQVSLVSGQNICLALRGLGHDAVLIDMYLGLEHLDQPLQTIFSTPGGLCGDHVIHTQEPDLPAVRRSRTVSSPSLFGPNVLELCALADIVFLGLHGECGEDGRVQAAFDLLGIPYTGAGYLASAMAMNKALSKQMMEYTGIPTPPWRELTYQEEDIPRLTEELPIPCAVKVVNGGSSIGMALSDTREDLQIALQNTLRHGNHIIVEQKIKGRDLTVGVLGNRCLPAVEMIPQSGEYFDYIAKYQAGGSQELCPAPISEEQRSMIEEAALKLHHALGLDVYSRTDFILDTDGRAWCLEINTLPGMTPESLLPKEAAAVGMSYQDLCAEILALSLKKSEKGR